MAVHRDLAGLTDVELASLAAAGGQAAFGVLTIRHAAKVRGLLRRMGAQPALADDMAQDAFIAAFASIGGYRGEGSFGGWVCRVAARTYIRHIRREARYELMAETPDDTEITFDPGLKMDLDAALQQLSRAERLCVPLCSGAGMSHPEAADALNLPLGTVKSHVKRGLDKLRRLLAPEVEEASGKRPYG